MKRVPVTVLLSAEHFYLILLAQPIGSWRVENQRAYDATRDFIAEQTGRNAEAIQNEFEERALANRIRSGGKL